MDATIEKIKQLARESWPGKVGEERAEQVEAFLRQRIPEYATAFGLSETEVMEAIEGRRNYSAVNYYQEANFPSLKGVRVFESQEALEATIPPGSKFRCSACGGESTNPYECNSGKVVSGIKNGKKGVCNWKTFGFLRTAGKGFRFTIKEGFLEKPMVDEIFMPVCFESEASG